MSVPFTRPDRWRRRSLLAICVAALVLLANCGDDGDDAGASSTTTADTTPTSTSTSTTAQIEPTTTTTSTTATTAVEAATPEQEIIDRYVGFWQARFDANSGTPDPDHPGLAEYATGAQLENVIAETQRNRDEGLALRHREDPVSFQRVEVISIDGDTAVVQECFVDDGLVVRRDTGEIVDDGITTQNVQGTLERVDGRWKVARAVLLQESEGVSGCALAS